MRFDGRAFQGHGAGQQTAEGEEKKEAEEGVDDSRGGRTSRTDGGLWEILYVCAGEYQIKKKVSWENFSLIKSLLFTVSLSIFSLCSVVYFFI